LANWFDSITLPYVPVLHARFMPVEKEKIFVGY